MPRVSGCLRETEEWEIVVTANNGSTRPEIRIRLLGDVSAAVGGNSVSLGPPKCQALLAALALAPDTTVPVARLVTLVWGESPPRTAEKTLQTYVARLRKELGYHRIERVGAGYRLAVPRDCVDVERFQRLLDSGDLDGALAEWSGDPLAALDVPAMTPVIDSIREQWVGARESRLAGQLDTDPASTISDLTELTAAHPFREGLWRLLITALYRVGRQADALATYRRARAQLVTELGVEPGPALREVERSILTHQDPIGGGSGTTDPATTPRPSSNRTGGTTNGSAAEPSTAEPSGGRGNLPRRLVPLIGRQHDLELVDSALRSAPMVTLVGPGGIGKTALALAAARRIADDAATVTWLVDLATVLSNREVPRAVADVLRVSESTPGDVTDSVVRALAERRALIVMDNCEHVVDGAARVCRALVDGCPAVTVLATSREVVGVAQEQLVPVAPLNPAGPAAELFVERARAVDPGFAADPDQVDVIEICRQLDGVPLAIELAAARTRSLTPAQIRTRLGDRLQLLTGGRRDRVERHRTLRAAIAWSFDLLAPAEQQLFCRLSIFTGHFDLEAAEAVVADPGLGMIAVDQTIGALVDRSMLTVEPGPFGRRFRLLETMRQYGAELLAQTDTAPRMADRHAQWVLNQVRSVHTRIAGLDEVAGVARLREIWPNLRAAVDRALDAGIPERAAALVEPIAGEVLLRSAGEIGDWAERVLAAAAPSRVDLRIFGLVWAAHRYTLTQDRDAYQRLTNQFPEPDDPLVRHARAFLHEDWAALLELAPPAMAERRNRGQDYLAELMETDLATSLMNLGHFPEADALCEILAQRYRHEGPPTLLNWSLMLHGYSASFQERHDEANRLFDEGVAVAVPPGTHTPNGAIEARVAFRRRDTRRAFHLLRSHVTELLERDNMQGVSIAGVEFVNMMFAVGRTPDMAPVAQYLEATLLHDAPFFHDLVADALAAAHQITAPDPPTLPLTDRAAAHHMRAILNRCIDQGRTDPADAYRTAEGTDS